jgi:excisionase family DNA binding protein
MEQLFTLEEAADRLGTPLRFVRRLIEERRIGFTKIGRYVRIPASDLEAYIDAGRVAPGGIQTRHRPIATRLTRAASRR